MPLTFISINNFTFKCHLFKIVHWETFIICKKEQLISCMPIYRIFILLSDDLPPSVCQITFLSHGPRGVNQNTVSLKRGFFILKYIKYAY